MRITACLVAVFCAAGVALAQEPIEWSLERKLTKGDFRGRVPANTQHASLSWINIEAEWECSGDTLISSARATFDPSRSWWRNSLGSVWGSAGERTTSGRAQQNARRSLLERDLQLLEHEQLHFDLAEAITRRIRARFTDFRRTCEDPGGLAPIQQMVAEADRELQEAQQRYDRETSHGINGRAQEEWRRRIHDMLKSADRP
jgi:hypothetical protein